jgi:hypothetical protein
MRRTTIRLGLTGIFLTWSGASDDNCVVNFHNDDGSIIYNVGLADYKTSDLYQDSVTPTQTISYEGAFIPGQRYLASAARKYY